MLDLHADGHARAQLPRVEPCAAGLVQSRRTSALDLVSRLELLLDRIAVGLAIVDGRGRVERANRPARELLRRARSAHDGSALLVFADPGTQRAFREALVAGIPQVDAQQQAHRSFLVRDAAGRAIARARVQPLQRRQDERAHCTAHLLSLYRQPEQFRACEQHLRGTYGLTASEARVAAHVAAARSLEELAAQLRLTRNTVKTHLKRVFRKCQVATLAQLAALIVSGPEAQ